jgi:hypothetical protein
MPYHAWREFRKQRRAAGVRGSLAALVAAYWNWPQQPNNWNAFRAFDPADNAYVAQLTGWNANLQGTIQIPLAGVPQELVAAIARFGALLQTARNAHVAVPPLQASARGSVLYDTVTDKLYYAVSRNQPGLIIHPTLVARQHQIPALAGQAAASLLPGWPSFVCAEFRALNQALLDGAQESDLEVWTFRARDMQPTLRCPNCRVTVPWNALHRIWTC